MLNDFGQFSIGFFTFYTYFEAQIGLKRKKVSNIVTNKKSRRETRPQIIRDSRRYFPACKAQLIIQFCKSLKLQDLWTYLGVTTPPLLAASSQNWPVLVPTIILTTFHHTYTLKSVIQIRRLTTDKSQNLYYKFSLLPFLCHNLGHSPVTFTSTIGRFFVTL